ncbi:MAG: glycoside hydrolase family 97 N-terminal domain-containing protein [Rikenellaceae bacterium]
MKRFLLSLTLICTSLWQLHAASEQQTLISPNGDFKFCFSQVEVNSGGQQMVYTLSYKGTQIISQSQLGVEVDCLALQPLPQAPAKKAPFWGDYLTLISAEQESVDQDWVPVYGERSTYDNRYNEMTLKFADQAGKNLLDIIVRAYDQGVAFRYHFTDQVKGSHINVLRERTNFTLPKGTKAYHTTTAQGYYTVRPLEDWGSKEIAERPLTLELPDGQYVALCEAEMIDFSRGKFKLAVNPYIIEVSMEGKAEVEAPYSTPWRLIMAADSAVDLINNNYITLNLNEPNKLDDTSWIKPGKVFRSSIVMEDAIKSVDFAAARGFQYVHLDAGWYGSEFDLKSDATTTLERLNLDMKELCDYAASKGLGIFVYVNRRALETQLDEVLPLYKEWGIKGIKFGFVNVGSQKWTSWLHESVRKCAEYGFMVDVHDEYRPTGYTRTYPHFMTQEGIGGNEVMPGATHNTILPYTRMVCGAADYTFCYFSPRVKNTKAHQLGSATF